MWKKILLEEKIKFYTRQIKINTKSEEKSPLFLYAKKEGENMALKPVHIDINQELREWLEAVKGKQVRAANVSALTKIQTQANAAIDFVIDKGDTIDNTVTEVQTVKGEAQAAVDHANSVTAEYKQYADNKLAQTEAQRHLAENAKQGADDAAVLAESWAVGGTGTRPEENTNSSKYYCDQSGTYAQNAKMMRIGRHSIPRL